MAKGTGKDQEKTPAVLDKKSDAPSLKKSSKTSKSSNSPASGAKASPPAKKKKGHKVTKYLKDLKAEFKKVVWPSKKDLVKNTGIVLAFMVAAGIFVGGLDLIFSQLVKLMLGA